jgi:hypothetical protein
MGEAAGHPFRGNQWTTDPKGFPKDAEVRDGFMSPSEVPGDLIRDILADENRAIDEETRGALYDYIARGDDRTMNSALRKNPRKLNEAMKKDPYNMPSGELRNMTLIQQTLLEPLPTEAVVYRHTTLSSKALSRLESGKTVRLSGFQSTSLDPSQASGFPGTHMLEIKAKQGRLLEDSAENEVLLPHGSRFKVVGRRTVQMRVNPGRMFETNKQPIREVEIIQLEQIEV